ncbi:sulfotransferase 6B1-like isoform 1-T5 [Discoglossus pictus]
MSDCSQPKGKYLQKFLEELQQKAGEVSTKTAEDLLFTYKGILYASYVSSKETLQALETFEAREDDLLIVTYPKCGTNWVIKILHEMVYSIHNKEPSLEQAMIEFGKPEKVKILKERPSPRVFSSHLYYDNIPKSFFEMKAKIVVVFRNPKDTAVSFFHFHNSNPVLPTYSSWDLFFQDFMRGKVCHGSYFDHAIAWDKHIDDANIMILTYEDMKDDYRLHLKLISEFLELSLSDEQLQLVESRTTFKSMKEKSKDTHGILADALFRKGEIGDWKSLFTEAQSQEVDAKFEECLAGTKLGKKMKYYQHCTF